MLLFVSAVFPVLDGTVHTAHAGTAVVEDPVDTGVGFSWG